MSVGPSVQYDMCSLLRRNSIGPTKISKSSLRHTLRLCVQTLYKVVQCTDFSSLYFPLSLVRAQPFSKLSSLSLITWICTTSRHWTVVRARGFILVRSGGIRRMTLMVMNSTFDDQGFLVWTCLCCKYFIVYATYWAMLPGYAWLLWMLLLTLFLVIFVSPILRPHSAWYGWLSILSCFDGASYF